MSDNSVFSVIAVCCAVSFYVMCATASSCQKNEDSERFKARITCIQRGGSSVNGECIANACK